MLVPEIDTEKFFHWIDKHEPEDLSNHLPEGNSEYPMAVDISKQLFAVLKKKTKSDAKTIVKSTGQGEGLVA